MIQGLLYALPPSLVLWALLIWLLGPVRAVALVALVLGSTLIAAALARVERSR